MEKKPYITPKMEIIRFETEDVILTSPPADEVEIVPDPDNPNNP